MFHVEQFEIYSIKIMSKKPISYVELNQHLTLSECHPDSECRANNWWLYDDRAYGTGMNIGMRTKTRDEAFVAAIEFWAERARKTENALASLQTQVKSFVENFPKRDEEEED